MGQNIGVSHQLSVFCFALIERPIIIIINTYTVLLMLINIWYWLIRAIQLTLIKGLFNI